MWRILTGWEGAHRLDRNGLAEVEVFYQAAHWITVHNEFFQKESAAWTLEALDRGLGRAKEAATTKFDWLKATVEIAIDRPDVGPDFREFLADLVARKKLL